MQSRESSLGHAVESIIRAIMPTMSRLCSCLMLLVVSSTSALTLQPLVARSVRHPQQPACARAPPPAAMAKKKSKSVSKAGTVQVVLRADVKGVGKKGELVSVKPACEHIAVGSNPLSARDA